MSTMTAKTAHARRLRPVTITAERMFASLPEDGTLAVRWEGFGHVRGQEMFGTSSMRRGDAAIDVVLSSGSVILRHPLGAGRTIRTLTKQREISTEQVAR